MSVKQRMLASRDPARRPAVELEEPALTAVSRQWTKMKSPWPTAAKMKSMNEQEEEESHTQRVRSRKNFVKGDTRNRSTTPMKKTKRNNTQTIEAEIEDQVRKEVQEVERVKTKTLKKNQTSITAEREGKMPPKDLEEIISQKLLLSRQTEEKDNSEGASASPQNKKKRRPGPQASRLMTTVRL